MRRITPLALAAALACGSNPSIVPAGDFSGPEGLAIAQLPDRDLLFVANQGSNELRAITICATNPQQAASCPTSQDLQFLPAPVRLFAGSILVGSRPVRLAGVPLQTIDTTASPPSLVPHGAILVAGLGVVKTEGTINPVLQVVDAQNILTASQNKSVTAAAPQTIPMPASPIDVVAVGPLPQATGGTQPVPATSIGAVAVTQGPGTSGTLVFLNVTLGSDGLATATALKRCTLDFIPTRLALIPGTDDLDATQPAGTMFPKRVYVADGTPGGTPGGIGDGLVEVMLAPIPADTGASAPCPDVRRIPASDPQDSPRRARPLKSIALSPPSLEPNVDPTMPPTRLPAGHLILGVTLDDPALCANHGNRICPPEVNAPAGALCVDQGLLNCGAGGIVMLSNDPDARQSAVLDAPAPPPPDPQSQPPAPRLPLQPLRPPAAAREVAFLGRDQCPPNPQNLQTFMPPCTAVRAGVGTSPTPALFQTPIIGLASTEDGATIFIDVDHRRFFDDFRDTQGTPPVPALLARPTVILPNGGTVPQITFAPAATDASTNPASADKQNQGWANAGITRTSHWHVVWHMTMPGLESVSGNLSRSAGGPIVLTLPPGKDFTPWIASPELQLGAASTCSVPYPGCVGDFVRVKSYSANATCADLSVVPLTTDIPIAAVHPDKLELQAVPGFDPDPACFASGMVGGTFEVHAGDTTAGGWMVQQDLSGLHLLSFELFNADVLGRLPHGVQLVVTGARSDYTATNYVYPVTPPAVDIALSFTMTDPAPTGPGTFFDFSFSSARAVTAVRDPTVAGAAGFAGPMLVYGSVRRSTDELVITAITGSNSLLMSIPAQFGAPGSVRAFY